MVVLIDSTSTWEGDCIKNISELRQVPDESARNDASRETQYVDATVRSTPQGHFSYLLKSTAGRPYIRFTVPGKLLRRETSRLNDTIPKSYGVVVVLRLDSV